MSAEPKKPTKPAVYDSVRGPKDQVALRYKLDNLLGNRKVAYSSYLNKLLITRHNEPPKEEIMTIKFAKSDADRILTRLDKMATAIQEHHEKFGMSFAVAKSLVNDLDQTADEIEKAAFGDESFQTRQIEVLKSAKVIEHDADEGYMGTFNSPMAPHQTDADEGYMSQFSDDQTEAVVKGKSSTGRPLAP
jgi:hypothetical protein